MGSTLSCTSLWGPGRIYGLNDGSICECVERESGERPKRHVDFGGVGTPSHDVRSHKDSGN